MYRDDLQAALERVQSLERENERLKRVRRQEEMARLAVMEWTDDDDAKVTAAHQESRRMTLRALTQLGMMLLLGGIVMWLSQRYTTRR